MGRIDDLIQKYCPEGVEYVKLGDIANLMRGKVISKTDIRDNFGPYPVFSSQTANDGVLGTIDTYMYDGSYLTWTTDGAYAGTIFRRNGRFNITNVCGLIDIISTNVNESFLYYWLSVEAPKYVYRGMGNPKLMSNVMCTIAVPLPPLPIQEAIVEILDKFDRLSAELQAELQARKQQYEYYSNQLLTRFAPEQPVTEYSLGELGTITRGNGLQKKDFTESGVGCIHYGQIYTRYKTFTEKTLTYVDESLAKKLLHVEKGDLVIACTSENVEDVCKCVAWLGEDTIVTGGHACVYHHNQNPKYMAYFFQTDYFFQQKKKYAYGAKVIDIKPDSIAKITIPLPSLEEQSRIVAILDKFEALVNDLSQGLPAEIAAVQEQYEYYRNKLLTFKTKE